jgi:hypothetical protein
MSTSPVVEWRSSTTPFAVITSLAMTGSGYSGAIPLGTVSATATIRVYNNFAAAGGIADATNCILATYDDTTHQGLAISAPVTGLYLSVQVLDYNGTTTGADSVAYLIGGGTKHAVPVNSGTLSGSGSNYFTIVLEIAIPSTAAQGSLSQGLWLEYSSTA